MSNSLDKSGILIKGGKAKAEPDAEPPYSQNVEFIGQAYSLYCRGLSLPNVAKALKPEWPDVSVRTLQRMAKENGWEDSRAVYLALYAKAQASVEGLLPEVILNLQKIRMQMEGRGIVKSADIYAYRQLVEDLIWYTGKHPKLKNDAPLAVSSDAEVAALLEAIQGDDVVGSAWKKRRRHIEKAYQERLAAGEKATAQRKVAKKAKGES